MKNLKKIIVLFSATLLFISCNSDDSSPIDTNAQEQDLVGTWNLTEESQNGTVTPAGSPVNGNITSVGKNLDTQILFNENPNNFNASGSYTDAIKISVPGLTLAEGDLDVPISSIIDQGTWSLNQGVLTLTQNSIDQTVNIIELSATTLKIEFDIEQTNVTYQGFTGDINTTIKMTFEKL